MLQADWMSLIASAPSAEAQVQPTMREAGWREAISLTVALWSFVALIYLPIFLERHAGEGWTSVALDEVTLIVSMVLALPLFAVFRASRDWNLVPRTLVLAASVLAVSVIQVTFDLIYTGFIANRIDTAWENLPTDLSRAYRATFNYVCVFGVNVALFHLVSSRRHDVLQAQELARALSAAQHAQLAALRYQLNPHFLFNTLNAISAMIVTRRNEEAELMTDKLSSFLRASLASDPTELVPLDQELALIDDYLEIESIRFGDRLHVEIDCASDACHVPIPSFLLQPLIENAIKYGVAPSLEPVVIRVTGRREDDELVVTVEDDGRASGNAVAGVGTGVGLQNVRQRLSALYGDAASLVSAARDRGFAATIRLPARA
ncbi:histidine kinase [Sphingomonas sp. MAH-20]|uniref:Histidine kinase n=1 Tax=Sphingomonas horti TaxID=2682842 RepID=A0A6I4J338_9SPHN|nr:histidine kinase [Sphingomonas sp. CGMCC 1.13658]MBA2919090.1 histidine kinase [Sphingomonas sp. CGMCC 1.13658]MVO79122.1 histidine kinase [Sphingomonas horti]